MDTAIFQSDSSVAADVVPSPNFNARRDGRAPDMIVLHYTGMLDGNAALARLCAPDSEVSAHYVVFEDGRIVQCVPEAQRAWHAGISSWAGETDINSCSIGIEIVNPGHDFGYPDFPKRQMAATLTLCRGILVRRAIASARVLAHSDVAPARKKDPGEKFPWKTFHDSGVGHWVRPSRIDSNKALIAFGEESKAVGELQTAFADYGYGLAVSGRYDDATREVVAAFQRHFRPARVDGVVDMSTVKTLNRLLEARDTPAPARTA